VTFRRGSTGSKTTSRTEMPNEASPFKECKAMNSVTKKAIRSTMSRILGEVRFDLSMKTPVFLLLNNPRWICGSIEYGTKHGTKSGTKYATFCRTARAFSRRSLDTSLVCRSKHRGLHN